MARVRPFRAIRYTTGKRDITPLTAPPYDVIDDEQRSELLARDSHNIVALELPEGSLDPLAPGNRYATGAARWERWQRERVVARDTEPCIYVLEQRWTRDDTPVRRLAFIVAVGLERFEDAIILPHERTLPKALDDRLNLTRACAANFSQVFGLFSDQSLETSALFDRACTPEPLATAVGDEGVESRLWALCDADDIRRVEAFFGGKQIFIADGHHRYTTALAYRDERRRLCRARQAGRFALGRLCAGPIGRGGGGRPAVRLRHDGAGEHGRSRTGGAPNSPRRRCGWRVRSRRLLEPSERTLRVEELPPGHAAAALDEDGPPAYIVQTRDGRRRLARLLDDVDLDVAIDVPYSSAWKHLDVAVLQELVLEPLLGIHPDRPQTLDRLAFVKDAHQALKMSAEHDVVFILRPTRIEQLRRVALAGETMPQKSTYFYPKLLSGIVMRSLD